MKNEKKTCFIITPIGDNKSQIFRKAKGVIESVIRPVLIEDGFDGIEAAHEICEVGSINTQIINRIIDSDLVVANLTGNNPNVMYELCLRHVVAKPIIHICEYGTELPFDIKDSRTIFYDDDLLGAKELTDNLRIFLKEISYEKEYKDNPIYNAQKIGNLLKDISDDGKKNAEVHLLETILNKINNMENNRVSQKQWGIENRKYLGNISKIEILTTMRNKGNYKVRIHEVAKELNIPNKMVFDILDEANIHPVSHMSTLSVEEIEVLINYFRNNSYRVEII